MVKITGTVPASAPVAWVTATATVGLASSLTIVTVPVPVAIVAPTGGFSTTVNVSLASPAVSPLIVMVKVFVVWPAVNDTVPLAATKSPDAEVAVPLAVAHPMLIGPGAADDSVTVRVTRLVPALPSLIETLLIEADGGAASS